MIRPHTDRRVQHLRLIRDRRRWWHVRKSTWLVCTDRGNDPGMTPR